MRGSWVLPSHEAGRRVAPKQFESDRGGVTVRRNRRTLGQTNTLLERGVDLERLCEDRLRKVQTEMRARDVGVGETRLGVDCLDYHGFSALQGLGVRLTDADDPVEAARVIKTTDEIELLKQSAAVCEAALYDLAEAIRPGVSEHEFLGVFYHKMLSLGGEHCFSRLLSTGHKTNPWFHEAGSKLVRPGDLVAFDTDMTGPEGYIVTSRARSCAGRSRPAHRRRPTGWRMSSSRSWPDGCVLG